jgi:hypothetical protein
MPKRSFASDNNAGVHPEMIEAIRAANEGHVVAYGDDPFTARAVKVFQKHFGKDIAVHFVFGGTGANVLGLKAITNTYEAVVCAETAHSTLTNVARQKSSPAANCFRCARPTASSVSNRSNPCCTASVSNITCSRA